MVDALAQIQREHPTELIEGLKCSECGAPVAKVVTKVITVTYYPNRLKCTWCDWEHIF